MSVKAFSNMPKGMTRAYIRRMAQSLAEEEATGRPSRMFKTFRVPVPTKPTEVRQLRKNLGFKREQLAEVLGVSAEAVRSWELGKRTPDTPVTKLLHMLIRAPELMPLVAAA